MAQPLKSNVHSWFKRQCDEDYILGKLIKFIRDLDCKDKNYTKLGGDRDKKKMESVLSKININRIKEL